MPEKVESFEFRNFGTKSNESHDWDGLLDGGIYKCLEGKDFNVKKLTFLNAARAEAKRRGLRLRTGNIDGGCVIQAQPGNGIAGEGDTEVNGVANGTAVEPAPNPVPPPVVQPKPNPVAAKPQAPASAPKPASGPKPAAKK